MIATMASPERRPHSRWDQFVGNKALREFFWDMIWCIRKEGHRTGFNALIIGASRSGKTAETTFGIQCLFCLEFNFETMNPCGHCPHCRMKVHLFGTDGWETHINYLPEAPPTRFLYLPVDCTRLTEADLDKILLKVTVDDQTLKIIYLDEIHRLCRRSLDEKLLIPMERSNAIWIASSAYVKKTDSTDEGRESPFLEKMFLNRFDYRIETQKPTVKEMARWLAERCEDMGISCEDPAANLIRLAERSNQIPGMALQVLNKALKKRSKTITQELVDGHIFDFDD